MLVAVRVDTNRRDQEHILIHVNAVDLDRQQIEVASLDAIHSFIRAADSATKRREAADFDSPAPSAAGTSPSGNRTERSNRRVETLISIWFIAHLPSKSSLTGRSPNSAVRASAPSSPRTRGRSISTLPPWKPILPLVRPQRCAWRRSTPLVALAAQAAVASCSSISLSVSMPGGKAKAFKARRHARQRLGPQRITSGIAVDVVMLLHGVAFL